MRRIVFVAAAILLTAMLVFGGALRRLAIWSGVLKPGYDASHQSTVLPNGWRITPAGRHVTLPGDMVMKIIATADGRTVLASTAGWHDHSVNTIDVATAKITEAVNVAKIWTGMALNPESGAVFVSGGGTPSKQFLDGAKDRRVTAEVIEALKFPVLRLERSNGALTVKPSLQISGLGEKERFVAGVTYGGGSLFVVNTQNDTVYRLSGTDFKTQVEAKVGYHPYAAALTPDRKQLAVSNWGDESVSLLDARTLKEASRIKVGSHPNDLAFSRDGRLFVANAGSNSVSVIDDNKVTETIKTSFDPHALVGSTPAALAITADGNRLYVANADNNDVAVVDISHPRESTVLGFIPTPWYPSAIAVSPDGKKIFIGAGKGGLNLNGNFPAETEYKVSSPDPRKPYDAIGATLVGTLSIVDVPNGAQLAAYTAQVKANFPTPDTNIDKAHAERINTEVFP